MRHLVVGLILLLLACGWFFWRDDDALPFAAANASAAPGSTAAAAATNAPDAPGAAVPAVAPGQERSAADAGGAARAAGAAVPVRVIDATTKAVVPEATVEWWTLRSDDAPRTAAEHELAHRDPDAFRTAHAQHARADAQGRLWLPLTEPTNLLARADDRYGTGDWWPDFDGTRNDLFPGELLLEIGPDQSLQVRAVDADGRPVAAALVVLAWTKELEAGKTYPMARTLPPTDAEGRAELRHVQEHLAPLDRIRASSVYAGLAGQRGTPVALDPRALPKERVVVVVPPFGRMVVHLLGPDGKPWSLPARHQLGTSLTSGDRNERSWGIDFAFFDERGVASFPRVRCGQRFRVSAPPGWTEVADVAGPEQPGDEVEVRLALLPDACLVAGRVLDGAGAPFAGEVEITMESDLGATFGLLPKEPDGRFLVPVARRLGVAPSIALAPEEQPHDGDLIAKATLRGPLVPGRNELGDLVLARPPLLVAGQIEAVGTDPGGDWRRRCSLSVEYFDAATGEWPTDYDVRVVQDDGRFVAHGRPAGPRLRLAISGPFPPQPEVEFVAGTSDLRVRIRPGCSLAASFQLDPLPLHLDYHLVWAAAPGRPAWGREYAAPKHLATQDDLVVAKWEGLPPGPCRLLVRCPGLPPLLDLPLDLPDGGAAVEPRLLGIDLRHRVRAITIRLLDREQRPFLGDAQVAVRAGFGADQIWHVQDYDAQSQGREAFVVDRPIDLVVLAKGCRPALVDAVTGDRDIVLEPAPRVTLHWADVVELPPDTTVELTFRWLEDGGPQFRHRGRGFHTALAGSAMLFPNVPSALVGQRAAWSVETYLPLRFSLLLKRGTPPWVIVPCAGPVVEPATLRDGQTIALHAEPAALREALTELAVKK